MRDANTLQYKPFAYEKYKDYETKLTKDKLIDYIVEQCSIMGSEQDEDLKQLRNEHRDLGSFIEELKARSTEIEIQAKKVHDEVELSKQKIDQSKRQKLSLDEQGLQWKAQVDDLKGLITAMEEQRNKDVRSADKQNLTEVRRIMADASRAD